jgi:uncharacterized protein
VTLTDAGPLIALIDAGETDHVRCRMALDRLELPMRTTWPAFAEAICLLGRAAGWAGQDALWRLVQRGALTFAALDVHLTARSAELMRRYRDHPMDLADATLVAVAEAEHHDTIFTLDRHFRSYALSGSRHLKVVPD